jgi:hypothetical protein
MTPSQTPEPLDVNVVDLFNRRGEYRGAVADVKIYANRVEFWHEDGRKLRPISIAAFLGLTRGIWLDAGADVCLTSDAVAELQGWVRRVFEDTARDFAAERAEEVERDAEEALAMLNGRDANRSYMRQTGEDQRYREFADAAMETRSYRGAIDLAHAEALEMDAAQDTGHQFCRTGAHSAVPAVTLTFDGGARRLHWCSEHASDADAYRASSDQADLIEAVGRLDQNIIAAPAADAAAVTAALEGSSTIVVLASPVDPEPALAQIAAAANLPIDRVREVYRALLDGSLGLILFEDES